MFFNVKERKIVFTKKVLVFLVIGLFILIGTDLYAEQPIRLLVNGNEIFSDPQPTIINDRVMVPLRWISEALDAEVIWDETSRTVAVTSKPEPHFVRINGQLTTWPYWIKDGLVYMEYRNAIQLVREGYKHPEHQVVYFPSDGSLYVNTRKIPLAMHKEGEYNLVNISYLIDMGVVKFDWDSQSANFVSIVQ